MALITAAQLRLFAPRCDFVGLAPHLDSACREAGIDTPRDLRHFLAHTYVESQGFTKFRENLNYSVEGLRATFGRHRISDADCQRYGRKKGEPALPRDRQAAIANIVYGGPWGLKNLGNRHPGDGWRFIGRTAIHVTGRAGYVRAGPWVGLDLEAQPELAETPEVAFRIAAQWWVRNGLKEIVAADAGEDPAIVGIEARIRANELDDCDQAGRRVNGGTNGRQERRDQLVRAAEIFVG